MDCETAAGAVGVVLSDSMVGWNMPVKNFLKYDILVESVTVIEVPQESRRRRRQGMILLSRNNNNLLRHRVERVLQGLTARDDVPRLREY